MILRSNTCMTGRFISTEKFKKDIFQVKLRTDRIVYLSVLTGIFF